MRKEPEFDTKNQRKWIRLNSNNDHLIFESHKTMSEKNNDSGMTMFPVSFLYNVIYRCSILMLNPFCADHPSLSVKLIKK
jgi:hypothetical protein